MTLRLKGCCDSCPPSTMGVCSSIFSIDVDWASGYDLDVGVQYGNSKAGFDCSPTGNNPLWSGDDRSSGGKETFFVETTQGSTNPIDIFCHWYSGSNKIGGSTNVNIGNIDITITVSDCSETQTKTVKTGNTHSGCSCDSTNRKEAFVQIASNGFWTLRLA